MYRMLEFTNNITLYYVLLSSIINIHRITYYLDETFYTKQ